ncbi:MAG: hypothetical protein Q8P30_01295 [Candidatus Uhrbacteria bacterium]|nr:hypothetical protein [Candidatus Uhrbacteria bacterium]
MNKKTYLIAGLLGFIILTGAACTTTENTNVQQETASASQTYTSDYGFEIQYPQDWRVILEIDSKTVDYPTDAVLKVSFGSEARGESSEGASDGEWFVSVYNGDMPSKSIAGLITGTGTQFSDRAEKTENITINGIPAIKAVITTPSNPSWVYEAVLIEQEDRVFFITNGAIENDSFDEFYNSFKRVEQVVEESTETSTADVITYKQFTAGDTGMIFDIPNDVTVADNVNGVPDLWKFIYNENSYLILYSEARGDISLAWASRDEGEVTVTNHDNITVYSENGFAHTAAYFLQPHPLANITITKLVGTGLKPDGDYSSDLDEVYQRLVSSVRLDGIAAF